MPRAGSLLPPSRGMNLFCFVVFCFGFVAAISLAGIAPDNPEGRLTVQIMPDGIASHANEVPAAVAVLKATPGIVSTSVLGNSESLELVAPWLGKDVSPGTLPFPVLIDVRLAPGKTPDISALQKRLVATAPHAVLDDARRREPGTSAPERSRWMAALLFGICYVSFAVSFALLARARIAANRETLQLLHLLGATKARIARLLALPLTIRVVLASAAGTAVAGGLFLLPVSGFGRGLAIMELPAGELPWLASIPATAAIMAWLTGWLLVTSELRRL